MKKRLFLVAAALCIFARGCDSIPAFAQSPVTPIVQPHMTFVTTGGAPCVGCSLYSYIAGTTTPQPTYVDSTGTGQNTNPIILGNDGGANIWLGTTAYKLELVDTLSTTIWSNDNITARTLFPCATAGAIQIANTATTGLSCDPNVTINTTQHAINVGSLPTAHVTIGSLGTSTSWTFDTTTPATALASLGGGSVGSGTANQIAIYPSTGSSIAGSSSIPPAITATTQSAGDSSTKLATTAYVATPGPINPTTLKVAGGTIMTGNQGTGVLVQHSTGTATSGHCAQFDSSGNTVDAGSACATVTTPQTCNSNGCYRVDSDGTITEWGSVAGCNTGSGSCSAAVTFPSPFTSTTNLSIIPTVQGWANCAAGYQSPSTTGFTLTFDAFVNIGGSGAACPGSQTGVWVAIGH